MPTEHFESLESVYEEIIALMDEYFDSHEFILKLAQKHQRLYVQSLIEYADSDQPFQIAHGQIAKRLGNFPNLVTYIRECKSKDIFLQNNSAALWRKV